MSNWECPICGANEYIDIDYMRKTMPRTVIKSGFLPDIILPEIDKLNGFLICKGCGFITYNRTYADIINMYKKSTNNENRNNINEKDIESKRVKLVFHKHILSKYLEKMPKNSSVLDYGCATGYILNWIKKDYGIKDVLGIELNHVNAEYGRNNFDLSIFEIAELNELPDKKQYDLMISFAVLEHILNPVNALNEMRKYLKDDGIIYLMTPIWLNSIYSSAFQLLPFEGYFIPEHISCFTETSRNNCFKLAGFEIIEQNKGMYGDIVVLKKAIPSNDIIKENAKDIEKKLIETKNILDEIFKENK
jgi:2-polyprenyl-3-methyl-5-hydroxy-6-metoxy-1,4-benzoquinol methylase